MGKELCQILWGRKRCQFLILKEFAKGDRTLQTCGTHWLPLIRALKVLRSRRPLLSREAIVAS